MTRSTDHTIELEYDHFGDRADPPLLLVMGYMAQMTAWDDDFCQMLADAGRFVVRFDNRDCGLSAKTQGPAPNILSIVMRALAGQEITENVPYTLSDMAGDGVALMRELGIERFHVAGASMGGMIAQQMTIEHPDKVLSLTSIMSTTGAAGVGQPTPSAQAALLSPPPAEADEIIEWTVRLARLVAGPLFDEEASRLRARAAYERSFYPSGAPFQMAATAKTGDRTSNLQNLSVPTLVIHGAADTLIGVSGGEATAAAIPGARLLILDAMGHDLPQPLWSEIVDAIALVTR